jgi:hypothetical protein
VLREYWNLLSFLAISLLLCSCFENTSGEEDTAHWNKAFDTNSQNDYIDDVGVDRDNNVYVLNGSTGENWSIKKFTQQGTELMEWDITGEQTMKAKSLAIDHDNNLYVVGENEQGWHIKKFSSTGEEDTAQWNKTYGLEWISEENFVYEDHLFATSVAVDCENNVYVAGKHEYFSPPSGGDTPYFSWALKKFDSNGNELWTKKFISGNSYYPSMNMDQCVIAVDSQNALYMLATIANNSEHSSSDPDEDLLLIKFAADGTYLWKKEFDFSQDTTTVYDYATSIAIDSSDTIYISGHVGISSSNPFWVVKKIDATGELDTDWEIRINEQSQRLTEFEIVVDSERAILLAGAQMVKKFNSAGEEDTTCWDKTLTTNLAASNIAIDSNDDIYVAGEGENLVNSNSAVDWWIKKFFN